MKKFKGTFFIKPHPFYYFKTNLVATLNENDKFFSGIIYNNTASVIRKEFINIPKYFLKIKKRRF